MEFSIILFAYYCLINQIEMESIEYTITQYRDAEFTTILSNAEPIKGSVELSQYLQRFNKGKIEFSIEITKEGLFLLNKSKEHAYYALERHNTCSIYHEIAILVGSHAFKTSFANGKGVITFCYATDDRIKSLPKPIYNVPLDEDIFIGRKIPNSRCTYTLDDPKASSTHCILRFKNLGSGVEIIDMNSLNRTWVNIDSEAGKFNGSTLYLRIGEIGFFLIQRNTGKGGSATLSTYDSQNPNGTFQPVYPVSPINAALPKVIKPTERIEVTKLAALGNISNHEGKFLLKAYAYNVSYILDNVIGKKDQILNMKNQAVINMKNMNFYDLEIVAVQVTIGGDSILKMIKWINDIRKGKYIK